MSDFGRQLRAARHMANVTQLELASMAGLSAQSIAAMERGQSQPRLNNWHKLRDALRQLGVDMQIDGKTVSAIDADSDC